AAQIARRAATGASTNARRAIGYVAEKTRRPEEDYYGQGEEAETPRAPREAPAPRPRAPQPAMRERATQREETRRERHAPRAEKRRHSEQSFRFGRPFELPETDLLVTPKQRVTQTDAQTLHAMSRQLEGVLADFGVQGEVLSARPGP